jgi:hypothetical protein
MSRTSRAVLAAISVAALANCGGAGGGASVFDSLSPEQQAASQNADTLSAYLSDKTHSSYSDPARGGHGQQVYYMAPDGLEYLWYPGNRGIVLGRWKTEQSANGDFANICFKYATHTYNPVMDTQGGSWECVPAVLHIYQEDASIEGDIFGLATSGLPFPMPTDGVDRSFAELAAMAGISLPDGVGAGS